eukprot:GHVH01004087.1.p1 GENE.GHVH01004087.1~~GHVH01004087.1.p1  ORF type:complete len:448 (-),score=31.51 GHVH01004087.1:121-1464(-)
MGSIDSGEVRESLFNTSKLETWDHLIVADTIHEVVAENEDDARWRLLVDIMSMRIKDQEVINGNGAVIYLSVIFVGIILVYFLIFSPLKFVPILLAFIPCLLVMCYLVNSILDKRLSSALISEYIWLGGILSVLFACIMEVSAMGASRTIESCNADPHPSVTCDFYFLLTFVFCVGLVEEMAKLIPISRISIHRESVEHRVRWWHRFVDNPAHLVLCAIAGALGFSTVENFKYIFTLQENISVPGMIEIAVMRGILCIPLHFCCTGIAASLIALNVFTWKGDKLVCSHLTFRKLGLALMVPACLHGFYDAFIFLSLKTPPFLTDPQRLKDAAVPMSNGSTLYTSFIHSTAIAAYLPQAVTASMASYNSLESAWSMACGLVSFGSFLSTIIVFSVLWARVKALEKQSLIFIKTERSRNLMFSSDGTFTDYQCAQKAVERPLLNHSTPV